MSGHHEWRTVAGVLQTCWLDSVSFAGTSLLKRRSIVRLNAPQVRGQVWSSNLVGGDTGGRAESKRILPIAKA